MKTSRKSWRLQVKISAAIAGFALWSGAALAEPAVVATIKPIHSLVAGVMEGVGKPTLLIKGAASPHTYSLKPSEARALTNADVVFWVGEDLETFLPKVLRVRAGQATSVEMAEAKGVRLLGFREGGAWDAHEDDDHEDKEGAHGHAERKHGRDKKHDGQGHGHDRGKTVKKERDHQDRKGHDHAKHDMHFWLDPMNAKAMVAAIEQALSKADAGNADRYRMNAEKVRARLDDLDAELRQSLKPVSRVPYVVFHDAYQYFDKRYGLNAVGSITVSPETLPGAKRLREIRAKILETHAACVFSEPQFEPKLAAAVTRGTDAQSGVLDPIGAAISAGPRAYGDLLRNLAATLTRCLKPAS